MKIKIRPDDVGAPGGNEWSEMNGWLAELRDDSTEGPVMDGQRGPADAGQQDPADVHTERPVIGRQRGPADAGQQDPARTSWAPQRYPAPARTGVPGNARPPGRSRSARTGPPAGAPMRAVIGDELRMPIMWCEMDSCISWHADRTALGEADVRARAIRAGWRIDALGRLACPQCQQTKVAFRATRPVVLWDRATAIAMAARATAPERWAARVAASDRRGARPAAGPGSRPPGPTAGPYGRDPRHQATGTR